jgi:lipid-binding SYLF domain-containing protein
MMNLSRGIWSRSAFAALAALTLTAAAHAGAREEGRLLTATEMLEEVQGMPDQRLPDLLLQRAYGIAVIPDVIKIGLTPVGGRHGNGVLVTRDKLTSAWSNPVFISVTGGNLGFMIGAQSSDIILVFTTKSGIEGIAGGKLTLGADASVATGPVGRGGSASTDLNFDAEIYSYARTRGLFAGVALDGTVVTIDKKANGSYYGRHGISASEILTGQGPAGPQPTTQRFLDRLALATHTARPAAATASGTVPPSLVPGPAAPAAAPPAPAQTFPMDDSNAGKEPGKQ